MSVPKVEYLAFEGGGGKGAAYLGALSFLKEHGIIQFKGKPGEWSIDSSITKGISGSSAGAITAVLLVSGQTPDDIRQLLLNKQRFEAMLEETTPGQVPAIICRSGGGNPPFLKTERMKLVTHASDIERPDIGGWEFGLRFLGEVYSTTTTALDLTRFHPVMFGVSFLSREVVGLIGKSLKRAKAVFFDLGWLDGMLVRHMVATVLAARYGDPNISFATLYGKTQVHLKITGTCLNTMETVWFDHRGPWRHMPVADAIRISVSVPFAFKPVIVTESINYGTGSGFLFVDGGVLNNTPLHAFNLLDPDAEPTGQAVAPSITQCESLLLAVAKSRFERGNLNPNTLCFRLERAVLPRPIGMDQYAMAFCNTALSLSEMSQIQSTEEQAQTILLGTSGLSTLDFAITDGTERDPTLPAAEKLKEFETRAWNETNEGLKKTPFARSIYNW